MSWDDLQYILAVARHGTIGAGAKALRVNPTTVTRRLRAMEEDTGTALFERLKHGAVLTAAGEEVVAVAKAVERLSDDLDARIHGLDTRLEGVVRASFTEMALGHWISDFKEFQAAHPGIELELTSTTQVANITQREADVAVRLAAHAPEHLVGRKHAELFFAAFASVELIESLGPDPSYSDFPWVAFDLAVTRNTDNWLEKHGKGARIALRASAMPIILGATQAGIGAALLPCLLADADPTLRRIGGYCEGGIHLWVLTHPQLRGTARIRAFTRFMGELIARDKDLIEGRMPRSE